METHSKTSIKSSQLLRRSLGVWEFVLKIDFFYDPH